MAPWWSELRRAAGPKDRATSPGRSKAWRLLGQPALSPGLSRACLVPAGAVSALAKFGAQNEEMLPSILVLLKRCVRRPLGWRPPPVSVAAKGEKDAQLLMVGTSGDTGERETRCCAEAPPPGCQRGVFSV